MWNYLKDLWTAATCRALLQQAGFVGPSLRECVEQSLALHEKANEAMGQAALAVEDATKLRQQLAEPDNLLRTYFVPYEFEWTKHCNGGAKAGKGSGMTMVSVPGGVTDWQHVLGLAHWIKQNSLTPRGVPQHANVVLLNLVEVRRELRGEQPAHEPG